MRLLVCTAALALVVVPLLITAAHAQEGAASEGAGVSSGVGKRGRIPVVIVGGRLLARCDASSAAGRIPLHIMINLEDQSGLRLHRQTAGPAALDLGSMEVQADFGLVTLHFPGFEISTTEISGGPDRRWDDFTRLHSEKLGEVGVAGSIGAQILARYHLTLDLGEGSLYLAPPSKGGVEPPRPERGEAVVPITVTRRLAWLPVRLADGRQVAAGLGTRFFDSFVSEAVCADFDEPAGEIGAVRLAGIDLAAYVAFRPGELRVETDDAAGFLIGLNLLNHFRVEIDRVNRWARITPTSPPEFPNDDLAYFQARAAHSPEAIETFLEKYPKARLAPEGAESLLKMRMDTGAGDAALKTALAWTLSTRPEDLRATVALELARDLHVQGRADVAVAAAEAGIDAGKEDRDPNAVHHLHGLVGEILLERGEGREAWRHLLSAAFGIPEDGRVNLGLGRFYEQEGRLRRSFSRFLQASITADGGADAMLGLARVQKALGGAALGVDEIERLVAGKIQTYASATKFKPTDDDITNRTVLVEFFTTPHLERVGLAGELAFEASLTYYERENAVMLTYHLPGGTPTASAVAAYHASFYGVGNPGINVIDGFRTTDGAGRMRDREKMMSDLREAIGDELLSETDYALVAEMQVKDGHVKGEIWANGAIDPNLELHVILVEGGVVFPGKSRIVIHRMLARGALTEDVSGVPFAPDEKGEMTFRFDRALTDVTAEIEAHLVSLEADGADPIPRVSTRIDPEQVAVVAFLRDRRSKSVVQAAFAEPKSPDDDADDHVNDEASDAAVDESAK